MISTDGTHRTHGDANLRCTPHARARDAGAHDRLFAFTCAPMRPVRPDRGRAKVWHLFPACTATAATQGFFSGLRCFLASKSSPRLSAPIEGLYGQVKTSKRSVR
jgi:hypothetical protein